MRCLPGLFVAVLAAVGAAAGADGLTAKEITAARKIYVAKCAKCHRFYDPKAYSDPDWQAWMAKMNQKARLKPEQTNLLGRYLDSYRAGQLPRRPEAKP